MTKEIKKEAVIIGAGLTGLSTAMYLKKQGVDCIVLEKSRQPGGVIRTFSEKGFTYEAGPNTGVDNTFGVGDLFGMLSGYCKMEFADPSAKKRLIWKDGRWNALPQGPVQAVRTPLFTPGDKMRIMAEPFRRRGDSPQETLAGMVRRRLGESFLKYAVDPFISGIYAGDPEELVTKYALPRLYRLEQEYGSFIIGALKKNLLEKGPRPSRRVFSAEGGFGRLIEGIENFVGKKNIICEVSDLTADKNREDYSVRFSSAGVEKRVSSPVLISTLGAHSIEGVFGFISPEDIKVIEGLNYAPVIQIVLGFRDWKGMEINAFGGLVPSVENREILGVLFPSAFLKNRAPAGGALLNVFMGGVRKPGIIELSEQKILGIAEREVSELMQIPAFDPSLVKIFRYSHAIPQYGKDYTLRLEAIKRAEANNRGFYLAGNIQGGIGMADRIEQARCIADKIISSRNPETTTAEL